MADGQTERMPSFLLFVPAGPGQAHASALTLHNVRTHASTKPTSHLPTYLPTYPRTHARTHVTHEADPIWGHFTPERRFSLDQVGVEFDPSTIM